MDSRKPRSYKPLIIAFTLFGLVAGYLAATLVDPIQKPEAQVATLSPVGAPPSFSQMVKAASPSVVNISTVKVVRRDRMQLPFGMDDPNRDYFEWFFGDRLPRDFRQNSLGTGFIIDKDGFILTNNHVVEQTDEIKVTLHDGKEYQAEIIGRDPKTDLALIRIKPDNSLKPMVLGDSDKLEIGEWVLAIGNPFGLGNTVTAGIVSAKGRQIGAGPYEDYIQTDASINPGNSGGPLLNPAGEAVGINTAIFSRSGGSVGIGFAIPINIAKELLPQLKKGKVVRGWLGVVIQKITPELMEKLDLKDVEGALVADVPKGGPAEKAGIKRGDVILSFDGKPIKDSHDLPFIVASTPVGKTVDVEVLRKGQRKTLQVKIAELKEEEEAQILTKAKPDLGLTVRDITPDIARSFRLTEASGVVVVKVEMSSPAAEAGLRPGDLILEVDQETVEDTTDFNAKIDRYRKGDTVLLLVKRKEATLFLTLQI